MDKKVKDLLNKYAEKYETKDFIKDDPIAFPHQYTKKHDIEIMALLASSLAYGKREMFIEKLKQLQKIIGKNPHEFCLNFSSCDTKHFKDFKYRFNTGEDICCLFSKLSNIYQNNNDLEKYLKSKNCKDIKDVISTISQTLISDCEDKKSYCYLFPNPQKNSACKRLNLYLRWLIRKSEVDLGIWSILKPKDLIIPLDVHVARISRNLRLTSRKSNDWITAEEITAKLRLLDKEDPVKYDFALFGVGVNGDYN